MKTASLLSAAVFLVACHRDQQQPTARVPTSPPARTAQQDVEVPDLDLPLQQADDLPISEVIDPGAATKEPVHQAVAVVSPTSGQTARGIVRFVEAKGRGIEVFATVDGLDDKPHAFHVHVFGDCSAPDAKSAGPHFNFTGSSFDKEAEIITGNLGQLERQPGDRSSTAHRMLPDASLQGEYSIIGRAVVVHAQGNDPSVTPDGGAGARIACGVIGVANPSPPREARR